MGEWGGCGEEGPAVAGRAHARKGRKGIYGGGERGGGRKESLLQRLELFRG